MGDYANANTVPQYVTGGDDNSWTVAMWVLPYAAPLDRPSAPTPPPPPPTAPSPPPPQPPSPPPPDTPAPATRKLQSNDKTIRTRNVGEGAMNETTILAFESSAADGLKNEALLMYDGERFFYYDDNILDAASTSTHGSRPEPEVRKRTRQSFLTCRPRFLCYHRRGCILGIRLSDSPHDERADDGIGQRVVFVPANCIDIFPGVFCQRLV